MQGRLLTHHKNEELMMPRYLSPEALLFCCVLSAGASDMNSAPAAEKDSALQQITSMLDVAVGDFWIYDLKDETSGTVIEIRKVIVTDISNDEIATRLDDAKTERSWTIVYDKSWNILRDGPNRYSPNSGTGIRFPLKLNAQWTTSVD
jgi:hypothetical protein